MHKDSQQEDKEFQSGELSVTFTIFLGSFYTDRLSDNMLFVFCYVKEKKTTKKALLINRTDLLD